MADPRASEIPESLAGRYAFLGVLGRGAFGTVLLAEDRQLARTVALKLLDLGRADPTSRARFAREAKATARLHHPGVVAVFDHGSTEAGTAWIAYERVEGRDLRARLADRSPLPRDEALRLGIEGARALAAAHRAGIVHRDVKPANVMLRGDGRLVVCDFGLARGPGLGASLTATGAILGTPAYMAPEAWTAPDSGPGADQWAWAAVVYELVYRARLRPEVPLEQLAEAATRNRAPVIPPAEAGRAPALEAALLRALAVDPDARFPDLDAFADALGAARAGATRPDDATTQAVPLPVRLASGGFDPVASGSLATGPAVPWARLLGSALVLAAGSAAVRHALAPPVPSGSTPAPRAEADGPDPVRTALAALATQYEALRRPFLEPDGRFAPPRPTAVDARRAARHFAALSDPRLPSRLARYLGAVRDLGVAAGTSPVPGDPETRRLVEDAVLVLPAYLAHVIHVLDVAATESPLSLSIYQRVDPGLDRDLLMKEWPPRSLELTEAMRRAAADLAPEAGIAGSPWIALRLLLLGPTESEGVGAALEAAHRRFLDEPAGGFALWLGLAEEAALAALTYEKLLACPDRARYLAESTLALAAGHPGLRPQEAALLAARQLAESARHARLCPDVADAEWESRFGLLAGLAEAAGTTDPDGIRQGAGDALAILRGREPLFLPAPPRLLAQEARLEALAGRP